jgi:hypothetical protein
VGWFDLNGDGHIDSRNPIDGGDGVLIVPHGAIDLPTYPRQAIRPEVRLGEVAAPKPIVATGAPTVQTDRNGSASTNDTTVQSATVMRATVAYQRDGTPTVGDTNATSRGEATHHA